MRKREGSESPDLAASAVIGWEMQASLCGQDGGEENRMGGKERQVRGDLTVLWGEVPVSALDDYPLFKEMALQHYDLPAETYRKEFRKVDREAWRGSLYDLATRLSRAWEKWLSASGVTTFFELSQLLLCEPFYRLLPPELTALIQDQNPATLREAAALGTRFRAHRPALAAKPQEGQTSKNFKKKDWGSNDWQKEKHRGQMPAKKGASPTMPVHPRIDPKSGLCFYCHRQGHTKFCCPELREKARNKESSRDRASSQQSQVQAFYAVEEDWDAEEEAEAL